MAWQNKHPSGKPTGLSLPDLQSEAEPAAYLTCAHQLGHSSRKENIPMT